MWRLTHRDQSVPGSLCLKGMFGKTSHLLSITFFQAKYNLTNNANCYSNVFLIYQNKGL